MMFDVAVIGGGPGGYSAAFEAVKSGLSVILFESDQLGGTCLNRGCIPTKYLAHVANVRNEVRTIPGNRLCEDESKIDFLRLQEGKTRTIDTLRKNLHDSLIRANVTIVRGMASVVEEGHITCGNDEYAVKNIIIATGATVKKPFSDGFLNSDSVLEMDHLPQTVKIVGGGTVAVEFAQIFRRLGSEVRIQIRSERLLRTWNRESSTSVARLLKGDGIKIETKCDRETLKSYDADVCISALGVEPSLSGLNRQLFDIGESGGIVVDAYGRTKTNGIYAVGDVVEGSTQLAHHAMEEGRRVVQDILEINVPKKAAKVRCIYLSPEIAEVGMTEDQAKETRISSESVKVPLYSNSMNMIYGGKRGYIRLVADKEKNLLIGAQMMGERASDLISELCLAINSEIPIQRCAESVRLHPSFSEGLSDAFMALMAKL